MPTRSRNFILYMGDAFARRINLIPGPDSDIADWAAELNVFNDAGAVILSATTANGRLTTNNGSIEVDVADEVTAAIVTSGLARTGTLIEPANNDEIPYSATGYLAKYFLRVTSPGGVNTRLLDGQFCIVE